MKIFLTSKINIIVITIALIMIITSIVLFINNAKQSDIGLYNQALSIYYEVDLTLEGFDNHPVFPEENLLKAASYFQQSASSTTDNKLKSLALYNIGTLIIRDYLIFGYERTNDLNMDDAISMLEEAIRLDPNNEDAKYNLEFVEMIKPKVNNSLGLTSSSGVVESGIVIIKGY